MVSLDEPDRNRAFAASLGADRVLLSDPSGAVARAFGVAGPGRLYPRRWTFYIDRDGIVRMIDKRVEVDSAGEDIARTLGKLGFAKKSDPAAEPEGSDSGSEPTSDEAVRSAGSADPSE